MQQLRKVQEALAQRSTESAGQDPKQIETQKKSTQGAAYSCAYDPHSATVYAVVAGQPVAPKEDTKKDEEHKEAVAANSSLSASLLSISAKEHPSKGVSTKGGNDQTFTSLHSIQAQNQTHQIYANTPEAHDEQVFPSLTVPESASRVPDLYTQPLCLRFCPKLSTVELSETGLTATSTDKGQVAIGNIAYSEGVHYWEIICPVTINTIQFGIISKGPAGKETTLTETFMSSTKRSVVIEIDFTRQHMKFWLQGRYLKKHKTKRWQKESGYSWYPYLKFKEPNNFAILNPFSKMPTDEHTPTQTVSKLPESMNFDVAYTQMAYLTHRLEGTLLLFGLPYNEDETTIKDIQNVWDQDNDRFQIVLPEKAMQLKDGENIAVLKFKSNADAYQFVQYLAKSDKLNKVFDSALIAKMLYHGQNPKKEYEPRFDKIQAATVKAAYTTFKSFLLTTLLGSEEEFKKVAPFIGLADVKFYEFLLEKPSKLITKEDELAPVAAMPGPSKITYATKSDRLILASGSQIKAFAKDEKVSTTADLQNFSNFARNPEDVIDLRITKEDFELIDNWVWYYVNIVTEPNIALPICGDILDIQKATFCGDRISLKYYEALQNVQLLVNSAIYIYQKVESVGNEIQIKDTLLQVKIAKANLKEQISFAEAQRILSIVLNLQDQLWAMTQSDQVSHAVKSLWPPTSSRLHTTYGRLASLLSYNDSEDQIKLAELGLYNIQDKQKKLSFFQEPFVPVESIYNSTSEHSHHSLLIALEKQFIGNYFFKGLPTWNIPFSQTINSFPPAVHTNFLPPWVYSAKSSSITSDIDKVSTLEHSNYLMSTNLANGSINLWTPVSGLTLSGGYNFKGQVFTGQETIKSKIELYWNQFNKVQNKAGVTLYMKNGQAIAEAEAKPTADAKPAEEKKEPADADAKPAEEKDAAWVDLSEEDSENNETLLFDLFSDPAEVGKINCEAEVESVEDPDLDQSYMTEIDHSQLQTFFQDFQSAWMNPSNKITEKKPDAPEEEKKEEKPAEVKKQTSASKKTEVKPVDENEKKKVIDELMMMGFPNQLVLKAIDSVKNLQIDEVLDTLTKLQIEADALATKKVAVEYKVYSCSSCTFMNAENPGPTCSICGSSAPESAIKVDEGEKAAKIAAEKEAELKAQEEAAKKLEANRLEEEKAEERKRRQKEHQDKQEALIADAKAENHKYYSDSEIVDYFYATYNKGRSLKPLIAGAFFVNKELKVCDVHFVNFKYKKSYTEQFEDFNDALKTRQDVVESLYPSLVGNQLSKNVFKSDLLKQERTSKTLYASRLGLARIQMEEVHQVFQIGDDIRGGDKSVQQYLYIVVVGKKLASDAEATTVVLSVDISNKVKVVSSDNSNIKAVLDSLVAEKIENVTFASKGKLLVETSSKVHVLSAKTHEGKLTAKIESSIDLEEGERFSGVSNGVLTLTNASDTIRTFAIDAATAKNLTVESSTVVESDQAASSAVKISEEDVLKLSVDPEKITIEDIDTYQTLMNGSVALASSNATYRQEQVSDNLFIKHVWTNTASAAATPDIGPMELKFERPTSLVSLNLDLTFTCNDFGKLVTALEKESSSKEDDSQSATQEGSSLRLNSTEVIDTTTTEEVNPIQPVGNHKKLGLFSTKAFDAEDDDNSKQSSASAQEYLPLVTRRNKGSCYNQNLLPSKILIDDDKMFASNYGKPELTFAHLNNDRMNVSKISIRTPFTSKTGAYPLGEGLIFLSDTIQPFEQTDTFSYFTVKDYQVWKKERMKDPRPLRPNEPVAFFQFDSAAQITFGIDFQRPARYIMLKPTGFRRKPHKISQNPSYIPMEIQFFGAIGTTQEDNALDCVVVNDTLNNIHQDIFSGFDCEIKLLDSETQISVVKNFKIDQLRLFEQSISPATIIGEKETIAKSFKVSGLSLIRIADSTLQLEKIGGVSITLKSGSGDDTTASWTLSSAQIEGLQAFGRDSSSERVLFGNSDIPTTFHRSCLLSPKYFNVINKQIASLVSNKKVGQQVRFRALAFLKQIMRIDPDFVALILKEIDLKEFLKTNIIHGDSLNILQSTDLLQSFQSDASFCNTLYECLIEEVQGIADGFTPYEGYEALLGMLKWAMPLDYRRTFQVLLNTLYKSLTVDKIRNAQTKEAVFYRTRLFDIIYKDKNNAPSEYPFDAQLFKKRVNVSNNEKKVKSKVDVVTQQRGPDFIKYYELTRTQDPKKPLNLKFAVKFFGKVTLNKLKLFFEKSNLHYSVHIQVTDGAKVIAYQTYPVHVLNQLTHTDSPATATNAITLSNLNHESSHIQVDVTYQMTTSTQSAGDTASATPPQLLIECYGKTEDKDFEAAYAKETKDLDKQKTIHFKHSVKFYQKKVALPKVKVFIPMVDTVEAQKDVEEEKTKEESEIKAISEKLQSVSLTDGEAGIAAEIAAVLAKKQAAIEALAAQYKNVNEQTSEATKEVAPKEEATEKVLEQSSPDTLLQLQEELHGQITSLTVPKDKATMSMLVDVINNIKKNQESPAAASNEAPFSGSLQYFMQVAYDITRLLRSIKSRKQLSQTVIRQLFGTLEVDGLNLAEICLDFFTHLIVNEHSSSSGDAVKFIRNCVIPLMSVEERREFYLQALDRFLRHPLKHISQVFVVEIFSLLKVPQSDLIFYMATQLGLDVDQASSPKLSEDQNPISMLFSVLVLSSRQLKEVELPEYGKIIHEGVSCAHCKKHAIVGHRYKCGNCSEDYNVCALCSVQHITEKPDHVFIVMKEALPLGQDSIFSPSPTKPGKVNKQSKPLLPPFDFEETAANHRTKFDITCDSCFAKNLQGEVFKCANCEDYVLCQKCYSTDSYKHHHYHVFLNLKKAPKQSAKTQIALLQVLDSGLYTEEQLVMLQAQHKAQAAPQKSPSKVKDLDDDLDVDGDVLIEDLAPISMSRSKSVAVPTLQTSKQNTVDEAPLTTFVDFNKQYTIIYAIGVWIARNTNNFFNRVQRVELLSLIVENMYQLGKVVNPSVLVKIAEDPVAVQTFLIEILQLNDPDLLAKYQDVLQLVQQRQTNMAQFMIKDQDKVTLERKQQLRKNSEDWKELMKILTQHQQVILSWLIDVELDPESVRKVKEASSLVNQCLENETIWLQHINKTLDLYIMYTKKIKSVEEFLQSPQMQPEKKKEALEDVVEDLEFEDDADLAPIGMSRSLSHPIGNPEARKTIKSPINLIKSLVQIISQNSSGSVSRKGEVRSTKFLSQIWSIALRSLSLQAVSVHELVEAHLFEQMIQAFLLSDDEIQNNTVPQILAISEMIAADDKFGKSSGKFICNLLFTTLDNLKQSESSFKIVYTLCKGWLDLLITGQDSASRNSTLENNAAEQVVAYKIEAEDASQILLRASKFLIQYLNVGNFEGSTGAHQLIVLRLNLVHDLLLVARHANDDKGKVIQQVFTKAETSEKVKNDLSVTMHNLLLWLFLSGREDEHYPTSAVLYATKHQATFFAELITKKIQEILIFVADSSKNVEAIKTSLKALTKIVMSLNSGLVSHSKAESISIDSCSRLADRTNSTFIKLLSQWLVSDEVVKYFVFELQGFAFLLDTIGTEDSKPEATAITSPDEESKDEQPVKMPKAVTNSFEGSDLFTLLQESTEKSGASQSAGAAKVTFDLFGDDKKEEEKDKKLSCVLEEHAKLMKLIQISAPELQVSAFSRTDWQINKRCQKHKILTISMKHRHRNEQTMLFKLDTEVVLREVQIGFINYQQTDAEVYEEPLSVHIRFGIEQDNLQHAMTLNLLYDHAYAEKGVSVFAKNVQEFVQISKGGKSLEEVINQKLESMGNLKARYIEFSMRRNIVSCTENSLIANKISRPRKLGLNYISLVGISTSKAEFDYASYVKQQQKKTALEVMSLICQGDFAKVLKVIANQEETINKIKSQFNLLASLIEIKSELIEPTFISISTHNPEMGDWIINRLLNQDDFSKHASLTGKLIICDKSRVAERQSILLMQIISTLDQLKKQKTVSQIQVERFIPFIIMYTRTIQLVAPLLASQSDAPIDLNVSKDELFGVFNLMNSTTSETEKRSEKLRKFLILLLCPPAPFENKSATVEDFADKLLLKEVQETQDRTFQKRVFVSVLACQNAKIAARLCDLFKSDLDDLLKTEEVVSSDRSRLSYSQTGSLWINLLNDLRIKKTLQTENLPLKIYNFIKEKDPEKSGQIIRNLSEDFLALMVELILRISAGNKEIESKLAEVVIADFKYLKQQRDMFYINKMILPLIKNEATLPVCVYEQVSKPSDEKSESDKWSPNFDALSSTSSVQNVKSELGAGFLPSTILTSDVRPNVIKAFKEVIGGSSKSQATQILQSQWVKAHQTTQEKGNYTQFRDFFTSIAGKGPLIMLVNGTTSAGKKMIYGGFCSRAMPPVPSTLENDNQYDVASSPEDFFFVYVEKKGFKFYKPQSHALSVEIFTDYDGGGAFSMGSDFMMISYSIDFNFTVGITDPLAQLDLSTVPTCQEIEPSLSGDFKFGLAEVWTCNLNQKATVSASESLEAQKSQRQNIIQQVSSPSFRSGNQAHPWIQSLNPYNLFRTRPVFMVPSHLTVKQISTILLTEGVALSSRDNKDIENKVLAELYYTDFLGDKSKSERQNNILDLEFSVEQLLLAKEEDKFGKSDDGQDLATRVSAQYAPRNGFFDAFESQGGVKQFIQVTLASLNWWKNEPLRESWGLWLKELDSFSDIPLYFQLFLKNNKCKELLFKVLQGEPDAQFEKKEDRTRWENEQKDAVQFNYKILSEAFAMSDGPKVREEAIKCDFLTRILERLGAVSGEKPRVLEEEDEVEETTEEITEPTLKKEESLAEDGKKKVKKRKGVGYSTAQGQQFNVNAYLANKKARNEQIQVLVDICTNFFNTDEWQADKDVLDTILESPLLPLLESAFRNGSWLDMAKEAAVYHSYMALTRAIARQHGLIGCLADISKKYKPAQTEPIYKLLNKLNDLASIFLSCLNQQKEIDSHSEVPEKLARDVTKTQEIVVEAIEELLSSLVNENFIEDALKLPIQLQYRQLLQGMRFDYMSMKQENTEEFKHHYNKLSKTNMSPPPTKLVRMAQELADLSNALPAEHTNAVYVRVDQQRVDMMKAMITGAVETPYAHGCYEFDIFFENSYPAGPPKMNLMTTGVGAIRFNPNLYACGKVCLSLLGTWRGQASENWDPKLSTILQVLLSVQAIIMSQEVYFNEPGFEGEQGTPDGEKRNEGYMNIVRYGNVKFAMLGQLKNPPKGFETVVKRHFYIKKEEILTDIHAWLKRADIEPAMYTGLVSDHNYSIAQDMRKSKTRYSEMLKQVITEFEEELNKLDKPTNYQIKPQASNKPKKQKKKKDQAITEGQVNLDDVDMTYDDDTEQIDTTKVKQEYGKDIDIDDEAVKDRWSRYIGAMGAEAVAKQAAAHIFLSGAGALGIEISKNLVLSGCKSFTLHDTAPITTKDLSGQFFLASTDKQSTRGQACLPRLQQLNFYVRCKQAPAEPIPLDPVEMEKEPWNFQNLDVIVLTEASYETIVAVNDYCRAKGKKFLSTDLHGVFGRVFNDYGDKFDVLDKNGEELQDVIIKSISNDEHGIVELLPPTKHRFEDGDEVIFTKVEGMKLKEGEKHDDPEVKSDNINDTIHKLVTMTPYSFKVGDTRKFTKYESNGIAKQLRTKKVLKFSSFKETMLKGSEELPLEIELAYADFEKMANPQLAHFAFEALNQFKVDHQGERPKPWDLKDATVFIELVKKIALRYDQKPEEWKADGPELKLFYLFAFTSQGVFNPLSAFFGGFVAQEVVKAITNKFSPTKQVFYYDAMEVLPDFNPDKHLQEDTFSEFLKTIKTEQVGDRTDGLRIVLGKDMVDKIAYTNLFMVGAGAIGCELLKNYAMLGVGTGKVNKENPKGGSIVLTDPDIIEVSNLNRQFLFREKHLRMPKSQTAAAAAIYMNPMLKGNVIARQDKVHEGTAHIFTDKFFEDTHVVTNALDNVKARIYIDARCVTAKTPLLESGTLGPKGHVQVILPYKTESYGSQTDPEDTNEIPHCTLKMFPEETLHCVEWARDKFGKMFSQMPQSAIKILEEGKTFNPVSQQDIIALKEGLKMLRKKPKNFYDCIEYSRLRFEKVFNHDIKQLLHVYPLDSKTKEGAPFWALPKRPPTPMIFNKDDLLHCTFITSMACLRATIYHIEIPNKTPRTEDFRKEVGEMATSFKIPDFVPNDAKALEIQQSVNKADKGTEEEKKEGDEEEKKEEDEVDPNDVKKLKDEFLDLFKSLKIDPKKPFDEYLIHAEEFEKDNDANFHIDFMYSMGNCRASNYGLEPMDWITVKLKAGRIVPALATTTASISGLQTLELVKILKGCKKEDMRNVFLNLAVPVMQASEPGDVMKEKLLEGVEVSLWDRWEVKLGKDVTLEGVIKHIEDTYKGLEVRDVLVGNAPIYFHAIMSAAGKEQEKKKTLATSVYKLCELDADDLYIDLSVSCIRKSDEDPQILSGVPPVRVHFTKK